MLTEQQIVDRAAKWGRRRNLFGIVGLILLLAACAGFVWLVE